MKQLSRTFPFTILNDFSHGVNVWNDAPKPDIWIALDSLQNGFCAYCECRLNRKHIEHFRTRTKFPELTFDWRNLFGSCGDSSQKGGWNRCGIYKDNGARNYDIENIIKPDHENPSYYLLFLTSGRVVHRPDLNPQEKFKAMETIRVLNLDNNPELFNRRKKAIEAILVEVKELYSMREELNEKDWKELFNDALQQINGEEFQTALEHAWSDNRPY